MTTPSPVSIVTGAGSGIGRAVAILLAGIGHRLVLVGRRADKLDQTAALLPASAEPMRLALDVGSAAAARDCVARTIDRFARLDALVNNAAVAPRTPIASTSVADLDECFRVNALAPAYLILAAWPAFQRQRSGCIVNVSTIGTIDPFPGFFAYVSSKAAVNLMARCCALEGRDAGVRAFAVAPGAVETEMLRAAFDASVIPPERTLTPDHVARVIVECIQGRHDARNGSVIEVPSP